MRSLNPANGYHIISHNQSAKIIIIQDNGCQLALFFSFLQ